MAEQSPWYDAYPKPQNQFPSTISRGDLLIRLQQGEKPGSNFLLIDLRRTDHTGGTIKGSINLPAQTLYNSLPTLLDLCKNAGIISVIWYCGGSRGYQDIGFFCSQLAPELGSSRGRGTRAAGWFDDLLRERSISNMESVILLDGVAGWAKAGEEYTALMDDYDAVAWEEKK